MPCHLLRTQFAKDPVCKDPGSVGVEASKRPGATILSQFTGMLFVSVHVICVCVCYLCLCRLFVFVCAICACVCYLCLCAYLVCLCCVAVTTGVDQ